MPQYKAWLSVRGVGSPAGSPFIKIMIIKISLIVGFGVLLWIIIALSFKRGRDAEQIRRLKEEIKQRAQEQAYAQSKVDFVRSLNNNDINDRLRQIADKK